MTFLDQAKICGSVSNEPLLSSKPDEATLCGSVSNEPLLPSKPSKSKEDKIKKVSLLFGALIGVLVYLASLGVHTWLNKQLYEGYLFWSIAWPVIIATLVALLYLVLSVLVDELQPSARTTLDVETRFVAGFMCSVHSAGSCHGLVLCRINGTAPLLSLTVGSLAILFCGWLTIRAYERAQLQEIEDEEEETFV